MATFQRISLEEAQRRLAPARRQVLAEYRDYVRILTPDNAGQIELSEGEHPLSVRARLKAAAQAENRELVIERRGRAIVFWLADNDGRSPE